MPVYEGDRILAQWDGGPFWFPGQVHSVGSDGAVAVRYDDGMSDIRPANQVKPFDWAAGRDRRDLVRQWCLVRGADPGRRARRPHGLRRI